MEFGWWPSMTGTRDLELAGLLVHRGTGGESEGCWGPGVRSKTPQSSGAASRELLCSSRSPITPPSQRAMQNLRTSSSGKVKVGAGSEGQMGRGWNTLWSYLCCRSPSPNPTPDMKWKTKFWGKSLEIVPVGTVNVSLPR